MNDRQLDIVLGYLNEGIEIDREEYINETLKDMKDEGLYGASLGEIKRMIKNLLKKKVKETAQSKKNKTINKNPQISNEIKTQVAKEEKELVSAINKIINKLKSNSDFKNKIKETHDKYEERVANGDYEEEDIKFPPFKCKLIEELYCEYEIDNELYFFGIYEILDGSQEQRIIYSWVLHKITDELKQKYPDIYNKFDFSYGDGDEGCLYVCYRISNS